MLVPIHADGHQHGVLGSDQTKTWEGLAIFYFRKWRRHMKTGNSNDLFIERISFQKGVICHHVVHFAFLFSGPFYEVTCYGGDRVHSSCTVQEIFLCARDFQELTDFSQGFNRVLDYLYAWYINDATWKGFPGHLTSLGHTKVSPYFRIELLKSVHLWTQIS